MMTPTDALALAIEKAGSQSALARHCDKKQGHVWHWLHKSGKCPAEETLKIEALTGVSRSLLRPDIYPPEALSA